MENRLWHWAKERRPFVVYKGGGDEIGGGGPVPQWLDEGYCVRDDSCQCNLVGIAKSGAPRMINQQRWHHPGVLCSNSVNAINGCSYEFKCNCPYSRVKAHYPTADCNKHIVAMHVATNLNRSVVRMIARARCGPSSSYIPRNLSRREKSQKALLSKEERMRGFEVEDSREYASCEVARFLSACQGRRVAQRPRLVRWLGGIALNGVEGSSI